MIYILNIIFSLSCFVLFAQKTEKRIITNSAIQHISIAGDAIFKITIKTEATKNITLSTTIEGENEQHNTVATKIETDTLLITNIPNTLFEVPDNKLSAHKVLSIEVTLVIPKNLNLYCKSEIASADITGHYKQLVLELHQGNATLTKFTGNAIINTFNGNVSLETNNATINAFTKTGSIYKENITPVKNEIEIHSINGNINLIKTKK